MTRISACFAPVETVCLCVVVCVSFCVSHSISFSWGGVNDFELENHLANRQSLTHAESYATSLFLSLLIWSLFTPSISFNSISRSNSLFTVSPISLLFLLLLSLIPSCSLHLSLVSYFTSLLNSSLPSHS